MYVEVCELFGIFMLSLLSIHINKNHIGLYRDDGLSVTKSTNGPEAENSRNKRKLKKLLKEKDLDIIVQCNLNITNYLDITLELNRFIPPLEKTQQRNQLYSHQFRPPSINH